MSSVSAISHRLRNVDTKGVNKHVDDDQVDEADHPPVLWTAIQEIALLESRLHRSEEQWVASMLAAAKFRDDETAQHIQRMSRYAEILSRTISEDGQDARSIRLASQLHDIGKIGIPDRILMKVGSLTPEEAQVVRQHTIIGRDILDAVDSAVADLAASIACSHHERWDRGGYPQGLAGDDIPLAARISAITDTFDALTTNRIYRKAYSLPTALRMMRAEQGRQFDPQLLDAFFSVIDEIMNVFYEFPDGDPVRGTPH